MRFGRSEDQGREKAHLSVLNFDGGFAPFVPSLAQKSIDSSEKSEGVFVKLLGQCFQANGPKGKREVRNCRNEHLDLLRSLCPPSSPPSPPRRPKGQAWPGGHRVFADQSDGA